MTVAEMIHALMKLENRHATVFMWDGDEHAFLPVKEITRPSPEAIKGSPRLTPGAVVVWAQDS